MAIIQDIMMLKDNLGPKTHIETRSIERFNYKTNKWLID